VNDKISNLENSNFNNFTFFINYKITKLKIVNLTINYLMTIKRNKMFIFYEDLDLVS